MKLSKNQLKRVIQEELQKIMQEQRYPSPDENAAELERSRQENLARLNDINQFLQELYPGHEDADVARAFETLEEYIRQAGR